jgi:tRNA threonylcarbamoyladenosine biosynthesis protein TsaE
MMRCFVWWIERRRVTELRPERGTATLPGVDDTIALGDRLGRQLRAGDVVVLSGPLGAGKTALAKGIALGMDVEGPVTSPTYVLARVHRAKHSGRPAMVHVDVYRLLDSSATDLLAELDSLDLDTDLENSVVVVEWGEGLAERLSAHHLDVRLQRRSDNETRTATWQWSRP